MDQNNNKNAQALSAGFNGAVGNPGMASALQRLKQLLGGQAPAPSPQGEAQAQLPTGPDEEQLAKMKALQSIGGN